MDHNAYQGLKCIKCGKLYDSMTLVECPSCKGVLTGQYDVENAEIDLGRSDSIWHFRHLFPPISPKNITTMGEGWTPFIKADSYGRLIGARNIWCKLEGLNPSGSFKDRVGSLEVSLVKEWGKEGIFTASSGNAAAAISAYAARAGLKSLLLVREDSTISKLGQISMYGPTIIRVRNLFSTKESLLLALSKVQEALPSWHNGFVWALVNPLSLDALKTIAYEMTPVKVPDFVFVPTAGGDLLYGIYKGFSELYRMGLIENIPKMVAVQGKDASPLVQAIDRGLDEVENTEKADTLAGALRVNFGAMHPLTAVKESGGFGIAVSDNEILAAHRDIAKSEGIFTEVSSSTALAAAKNAISDGKVSKDDNIAVILTGSGFKDYYPPFKTTDELTFMESVDELAKKIGKFI